eukprot:Tbor_TRINITY_DN6043_c0_g1::TRINITY_DN6043_c0_g1_i1::g.11010::m.11010
MFKVTLFLQRWQIVLQHRRALPLKHSYNWNGKWGAMHLRYGRSLMSEKISDNKLPTMVDRETLSYVHQIQERQQQMSRSYSQRGPSTYRTKIVAQELRRRMNRKIRLSFIHFMQFQTMKTLEKRAKLTTEFGQGAVNRALGEMSEDEYNSPEFKEKKWNIIRRKVTQAPTIVTAPKYIATMKQITADRFDMRMRLN